MWSCPSCGEQVDEALDVCWQCGTDEQGHAEPVFVSEGQDPSVPDPGPENDRESATNESSRPAESESDENSLLWILRLVGSLLWSFLKRLFVWVSRRDLAIIALLVQLPFWAIAPTVRSLWNYAPEWHASVLFGIALFLPGAVKRRSRRMVISMGVMGGISPFVAMWLVSLIETPYTPIVHEALWPLSMMALVAAAYWLFSPADRWSTLLWTLAGTIIATTIYSIAKFHLFWSELPWYVATYGSAALLATLTWLGISIGTRVAETSTRPRRWAMACAVAAAIAGYVATFHSGIHQLARLTLESPTPFDKTFAVQLLHIKGGRTNHAIIADALEREDWRKPFYYPDSYMNDGDWRTTAVDLLIRHDEKWAAARLAALLRRRPSAQLIDMTDGLFVRQRRYDTAVVYLRYAFVDSFEPSAFAVVGANRYKLALEELRVPQVVLAWAYDVVSQHSLFRAIRARELGRPVEAPPKGPAIGEELRQRLKSLIGADAGPLAIPWASLYEESIDTASSPLSTSEKKETNRIVACFVKFVIARGDLWHTFPPGHRPKIEQPDWDVPTIEALEREVDEYVDRMRRATAREASVGRPT